MCWLSDGSSSTAISQQINWNIFFSRFLLLLLGDCTRHYFVFLLVILSLEILAFSICFWNILIHFFLQHPQTLFGYFFSTAPHCPLKKEKLSLRRFNPRCVSVSSKFFFSLLRTLSTEHSSTPSHRLHNLPQNSISFKCTSRGFTALDLNWTLFFARRFSRSHFTTDDQRTKTRSVEWNNEK